MDYEMKPILYLIGFDIEVQKDMMKEDDDEFKIACIERIGQLNTLKMKIEEDLPLSEDDVKIVNCLKEIWIDEEVSMNGVKITYPDGCEK